mmetsp:Transcript_27674/g.70076  ORF Transcript_27674/g.70076 Transcript_27674/m.70076 type:complete len:211 (-) Transcript_27674:60-692(-)
MEGGVEEKMEDGAEADHAEHVEEGSVVEETILAKAAEEKISAKVVEVAARVALQASAKAATSGTWARAEAKISEKAAEAAEAAEVAEAAAVAEAAEAAARAVARASAKATSAKEEDARHPGAEVGHGEARACHERHRDVASFALLLGAWVAAGHLKAVTVWQADAALSSALAAMALSLLGLACLPAFALMKADAAPSLRLAPMSPTRLAS